MDGFSLAEDPLEPAGSQDLPVVVSWGELLWDIFPDSRRLGGAAANLAYHAATLQVDSVLVSAVGADALGDEAIEYLRRAGVETRWIQRHAHHGTGTVQVALIDGQPVYSFPAEVAWDAIAWHEDLGPVVRRAKVFTYGTLAQRTALGGAGLLRTLGELPASCVRFCDLNLRAPFVTAGAVSTVLRHANVVKLNLDECGVLARLFGLSDRSHAWELANKGRIADSVADWLLTEHSIDLVAVTRGAEGSVLFTRRERSEHPGVPGNASAGDPVGAGDAFAAVLAAAIAQAGQVPSGDNLVALSERANRYASRVACERGGMPPPV